MPGGRTISGRKYPSDGAFVVQLAREADDYIGLRAPVEHVQSGDVGYVEFRRDLAAFVSLILQLPNGRPPGEGTT